MEKLTNWLRLVADAYDSVGDDESALYGYQSADAIEQQQQRIDELELKLSHIEQGEQATIAHQRVKIKNLCAALDNVLNHTSTDTIAEAVAVLERVRGTQ